MKPLLTTHGHDNILEKLFRLTDTMKDIRPLAVRPLIHPERVPNPWGFLFFRNRTFDATNPIRWWS